MRCRSGRKADVEHAVGLVEHHVLDLVQHRVLRLDVVEQPARRGDQHLDAGLQLERLRLHVDAAEHHRGAAAGELGVLLDVVGHLVGQLARGQQHQRAHRVACRRRSGSRACSIFCSSGIENAAVLPVPVWAAPITSRPASTIRIALAWMGVMVFSATHADPIHMILVTGSAGFISANFVLDWIARHRRAGAQPRRLTYAGNLENLDVAAGRRAHVFVQGDICDRALLDRLLAEHRPRAVIHFAAESHVDRSIHGPAPSSRPTSRGTLHAARGGARTGRRCRPRRKRSASMRLHRRGLRQRSANDPAFTETNPYEPNSPYSASRRPATTSCAPGTTPTACRCSPPTAPTTTGPITSPKLIPLMIVNALAGKPLPVYGDGMHGARLALREGPLPRHPHRAEPGPHRRDLQRRRLERKANLEIVHSICALLDELRPDPRQALRAPDHPSPTAPGTTAATPSTPRKIERELGWRPAETFDSGIRKTVRWYLDNADWVAHVQSSSYRDWVATNYAAR